MAHGLAPFDRYTRRRPNPAAIQALQACHAHWKAALHGKPHDAFPREALLELGRLYRAAWGEVPSSPRLKTCWCMPDYKIVMHHFGSLDAYHAALQQEDPICVAH